MKGQLETDCGSTRSLSKQKERTTKEIEQGGDVDGKEVKTGKKAAAGKAQHVFNVPLIDMQREAYARASLKTGLAALENSSFGKDFTFDFLASLSIALCV